MNEISRGPFGLQELNFLANQYGPILFVYINKKQIDWRRGYAEGEPLPDLELYARVSRHWQVQRFLPAWAADPVRAPKVLVGLGLEPDNRVVIASMKIRTKTDGMWDYTESDCRGDGRMIVPIDLGEQDNGSLDYLKLRGRKVSRDARLTFGNIPSEEFRIEPRQSAM